MIREFIEDVARDGIRRNVERQRQILQSMVGLPEETVSYALADLAYNLCELRLALWQAAQETFPPPK